MMKCLLLAPSVRCVWMTAACSGFGLEDATRVEVRALRKGETDRLALLRENVTVAIVKGGKVASKQRLEVPERLVGVIRCQNPTCVTNHERVSPVFDRVSKAPLRLRCAYCERASADPYVFVGA